MNIGIVSQNGHVTYGIKRYVVDEVADVDYLSLDDAPGSEAFCIENGLRYILNNKHHWVEKKGPASSDSGSGNEGSENEPLPDEENEDVLG